MNIDNNMLLDNNMLNAIMAITGRNVLREVGSLSTFNNGLYEERDNVLVRQQVTDYGVPYRPISNHKAFINIAYEPSMYIDEPLNPLYSIKYTDTKNCINLIEVESNESYLSKLTSKKRSEVTKLLNNASMPTQVISITDIMLQDWLNYYTAKNIVNQNGTDYRSVYDNNDTTPSALYDIIYLKNKGYKCYALEYPTATTLCVEFGKCLICCADINKDTDYSAKEITANNILYAFTLDHIKYVDVYNDTGYTPRTMYKNIFYSSKIPRVIYFNNDFARICYEKSSYKIDEKYTNIASNKVTAMPVLEAIALFIQKYKEYTFTDWYMSFEEYQNLYKSCVDKGLFDINRLAIVYTNEYSKTICVYAYSLNIVDTGNYVSDLDILFYYYKGLQYNNTADSIKSVLDFVANTSPYYSSTLEVDYNNGYDNLKDLPNYISSNITEAPILAYNPSIEHTGSKRNYVNRVLKKASTLDITYKHITDKGLLNKLLNACNTWYKDKYSEDTGNLLFALSQSEYLIARISQDISPIYIYAFYDNTNFIGICAVEDIDGYLNLRYVCTSINYRNYSLGSYIALKMGYILEETIILNAYSSTYDCTESKIRVYLEQIANCNTGTHKFVVASIGNNGDNNDN